MGKDWEKLEMNVIGFLVRSFYKLLLQDEFQKGELYQASEYKVCMGV